MRQVRKIAQITTLFVHWAPKDKADYLNSAQWKTQAIPASKGKTRWMFVLPMQVDGWTPLHEAGAHNRVEVARLLLHEAGDDLSVLTVVSQVRVLTLACMRPLVCFMHVVHVPLACRHRTRPVPSRALACVTHLCSSVRHQSSVPCATTRAMRLWLC